MFIAIGKTWYEEFKRFCYNIPVVRTELLQDHAHQVLHVSFSHNGKYFATCSKDGYVLVRKVFKSDYLFFNTFTIVVELELSSEN